MQQIVSMLIESELLEESTLHIICRRDGKSELTHASHARVWPKAFVNSHVTTQRDPRAVLCMRQD
jgi:hypothetical protein